MHYPHDPRLYQYMLVGKHIFPDDIDRMSQ